MFFNFVLFDNICLEHCDWCLCTRWTLRIFAAGIVKIFNRFKKHYYFFSWKDMFDYVATCRNPKPWLFSETSAKAFFPLSFFWLISIRAKYIICDQLGQPISIHALHAYGARQFRKAFTNSLGKENPWAEWVGCDLGAHLRISRLIIHQISWKVGRLE